MKNGSHGFILLALMFILLLVGVVGLNTLRIFRSQTMESAEAMQSVRALGTAQSGINWVRRYFADSENWPTSANAVQNTVIAFGQGSFQIGIASVNSTSVTIRVTGNTGVAGAAVPRVMSVRLIKAPMAALFVGYSPNAQQPMGLRNTRVYGNLYAGANVDIIAGSVVTGGVVYVPTGSKVIGGDNVIIQYVEPPIPTAIPTFNGTAYLAQMSDYDTYFTSNTNRNLSGTINLSAAPWNGEMRGRRFTITGPCAIIGSGIIAASDYFYATNFRLTVNPTPNGKIVIAAQNGIRLYGNTVARTMDIQRATLYSQSSDIRLWYPFATARNSLFLTGNGAFDIRYGAQCLDCNTYLSASNSGTTVFNLQSFSGYPPSYFSGTMLSDIGAAALNGVSGVYSDFDGFLYNTGTTQVSFAEFDGVAISNGWASNEIRDSFLTINVSVIEKVPGDGFDSTAIVQPGSWSVDDY